MPMIQRNKERKWPVILFLSLWILAGMVHLTQGIWTSGWRNVPGDAGDGRFNNLVLEHGYQAFLGATPFSSPGQFHPVEKTITYSDTHWGTLPFFISLRLTGLSTTSAFQGWACLVSLFNLLAVLSLLRVCRVPWLLTGPLTFLAASPASLVWFAGGHIQLLPFFPLPLALGQMIRFRDSGRSVHLVRAFGFLCWLHLCSPYLGFFGTFAAVLFFAAIWKLVPPTTEPRPASDQVRKLTWIGSAAFATVTGLVTCLMYGLYLSESRQSGTRSWFELAALAPDWRTWLTAPPGHWLYGGGWPHPTTLNLSEHALFSGWIPWAGLPLAMVVLIRFRDDPESGRAASFGFVAIVCTLFFLKYTEDGTGLFLWLAQKFDGLRAFRATGRVVVVVHLFQALTLAMLMTQVYRKSSSRLVRGLLAGAACLSAVEVISLGQTATPKERIEARREAVLDEWKKAGDRPILLFAPGPSNQSSATVHLDAWSAALATRRKTINGYSGNWPASHGHFLVDPSEGKGRAVLGFLRLPESEVSIVTSWGTREASLDIERFDTQPVRPLAGFEVQPARWELSFPVESFVIDGISVHQFVPRATIAFEIPRGSRTVEFLLGMRKGAYTHSGNSDGVRVTWSIDSNGTQGVLYSIHWNPRDREDHRGLVAQSFELPPGQDGELVLSVDYGPDGDGAWDWPVFGRLMIR